MASTRNVGPYESEVYFFNAFNMMKEMVEELYIEGGLKKEESSGQVKKEDDIPPSPPPSRPPSSPSPPPYPSTFPPSSPHRKISSKNPFLKSDVKFYLPMYNGESNLEKLDNWIQKMEVYCCVQ